MLMRGQVERVGEVIADIKMGQPTLSPARAFSCGHTVAARWVFIGFIAFDLANHLWEQHQKLVCAHEHLAGKKAGENVFDQFDTVKLKQIGCSNSDDTVTVGEARNPPPNLNWFALRVAPEPSTPDTHRYARRLCGSPCHRLGHRRVC
jgi:hypothetical protein